MSAKKRSKPSKTKSAQVQAAVATKRVAPNGKKPAFTKGKLPGAWPEKIILFLLPFLLYFQTHDFEYVLDDKIVLSENNFVLKGTAGIKQILSTESFTGYLGEQQDLIVGGRYRPLSIVSFALEKEALGLKPGYSHLINVFLYGLTAVAIFYWMLLLYRGRIKRRWWNVPFLVALIFVLHPIHSEAVANIKGRDEVMAMLLSMLALIAAHFYYRKGGWLFASFSVAAFFLGLLAKENTLTFLAVVPLSLFVFERATWRQALRATLPLLAITVLYLLMRYQIIGYLLNTDKEVTGLMNNPFLDATSEQRYATIFYTLGYYLKLLVWPNPLTHDYYPYQIPLVSWADPRAFVSLLVYGVLGVWAVLAVRKRNRYAFAVLFFIATLSIVSNLVFSVGTFMNERFAFMPSLAFCMVVAWLLIDELGKRLPAKAYLPVALLLTTGISAGYVFQNLSRIPDWKSPLSLNRAAARVSTNSARANSFYAYTLYRTALESKEADFKRKTLAEAEPYVDRALAIFPTYTDALTTKGGIVSMNYQLDRDIDRFTAGFYEVIRRGDVPFTDQYLQYMNKKGRNAKLGAFYIRVASEICKPRGDQRCLSKYINYAKQVDPGNPGIARLGG